MARYVVQVTNGAQKASLLVVLSPEQLCSALLDTVKKRLPALKSKITLSNGDDIQIDLHLDSEDGPLLDLEGLLSDVLPDAKDTVYAVVTTRQGPTQSTRPPFPPVVQSQGLPIRVITPENAHSGSELNAILPLPTTVSLKTTLKELKGIVQQQLGFPADDGTCPKLDCNCSFARQIDQNTVLNEHHDGNATSLPTMIVVHGNNEVAALPVKDLKRSSMQQAAKDYLKLHTSDEVVIIVGGVEDSSVQIPDDICYLMSPVLAVCSRERHAESERPIQDGYNGLSSQRDLIVDIHTSEAPIEITAHNANITLAEANLEDCAIYGVLNIFAVQRWSLPHVESVPQGKAGIFKKGEAWEHPIDYNDRSISNLLSTLRVFTHITTRGNMETERQDDVLHVIHLLTHFPPAVRAAYILMRGETPRHSERAALSQCLYEVLKKVVPLQIVRSDPRCLFMGTRLLFGLILEKAKNLKVSTINDQSELAYIDMRVFDLRNMIIMDPVLSIPVQTKEGLVDFGFYQAFQEEGPLRWTNNINLLKVSEVDSAWSRLATISGGVKAQVVAFNADKINSSSCYVDGGDISKIISPAEYTDVHYLANLCSRNQLAVNPPATLAAASPPVLPLDREGSLAVYVGRAACGEAGRDILMFRPTSTGEDEGVDVSIVTSLLELILAARTADGTIVFEAYGDHHRKITAPDEITVLCVDVSRSMADRCDFEDVQTNEDAHAQTQRNARRNANVFELPVQENLAFHLPDPDELKEHLKAHESFDDFLAIIGTGRDDFHRRRNAEKLLQILQQLDDQQIDAKSKELEEVRRRVSHYAFRTQAESIERNLNGLRNRSLRLRKHTSLLCAWFLTCLDKNASSSDPLTWVPGDAVPTVYETTQQAGAGGPTFEIPRDYCCHISNEIMNDPVTTVDNHTYERKNIERWFQTNETSPLTNLVLSSLELRPNVQKKEEIATFLRGSDIISRYRSLRGTSSTIRVSFKSPLDTWSIVLPRELKLRELWEIAFRLTKGRYPNFELQHRNARVPSTQDAITTVIAVSHTVFITPVKLATSSTNLGKEDIVLVKVYGASYEETVVSYWEKQKTTKSLASAVFRYYCQKFMLNSSHIVEQPFVFWTGLEDAGDGRRQGIVLDGHWQPLSKYFNRHYSSGTLKKESCVDKSSGNDETDDESSYPQSGSTQPLVFKLRLGELPISTENRNFLTRLDVLKQMFDAFINRVLAYGFQTHIGLVTFGSKASVSQGITAAVEDFRHRVNNMTASGDTAAWDSIALAQDQLQHYAAKYPKAKLRIICISDGEDNKSSYTAVDLSLRLSRAGIVVDSFCLGDAANEDLQTLSYLTGGWTFQPNTLEEAMAICEMEPVLSVLERPDMDLEKEDESDEDEHYFRSRFRTNPTLYNFRRAHDEVVVEHVTRDDCPDRKEHPELQECFVELVHFAKKSSQIRTDNNVRLSRIHNEIRNSGAKAHPHYDIYVCEQNMGLWKIVMQGPPGSTYAGGVFLLYVEMGANYPMLPPQARFITPIYHPNINRHGRICHSILDRNWTVDTTTKDLIDTIYVLLLVPEFSDPINTVVTLNFHWDEVQFKEEAQRHIAKHASKTRAEWREDIAG